MSAAILLALCVVVWPVVFYTAQLLDRPFAVTYNSGFYWLIEKASLIVKLVLGVGVLTGSISLATPIAIITLVGLVLGLIWGAAGAIAGSFPPVEVKANNSTGHFLSVVALIVAVVSVIASIIVL